MNIQTLKIEKRSSLSSSPRPPTSNTQNGSVLIAVLVLTLIVGVMATSMLNSTDQSQQVASATIQRDRAFQSIDSAIGEAEIFLIEETEQRLFADNNGSEGVFRRNARTDRWWEADVFQGEFKLDQNTILGVYEQPRYVIEEIGNYIYDGESGIVNLDVGSASYGRLSNGAREVVLLSVEAYGKGSYDSVQAAGESVVVLNF